MTNVIMSSSVNSMTKSFSNHAEYISTNASKKGSLVHRTPAIVGSREGHMYVASILFVKRLFPNLEPVTSSHNGAT